MEEWRNPQGACSLSPRHAGTPNRCERPREPWLSVSGQREYSLHPPLALWSGATKQATVCQQAGSKRRLSLIRVVFQMEIPTRAQCGSGRPSWNKRRTLGSPRELTLRLCRVPRNHNLGPVKIQNHESSAGTRKRTMCCAAASWQRIPSMPAKCTANAAMGRSLPTRLLWINTRGQTKLRAAGRAPIGYRIRRGRWLGGRWVEYPDNTRHVWTIIMGNQTSSALCSSTRQSLPFPLRL